MAECRFCSRKLNENENHPTVNDEIKLYFTNITQINLLDYEMCSKHICELCLRTLQLANALRVQLLENEQRLYDLIDKDREIVEPESPIQAFEPHFQYMNHVGTHENTNPILKIRPIHEIHHNDSMDYESSDYSLPPYQNQSTIAPAVNINSSEHTILNQLLAKPINLIEPPPLAKIPITRAAKKKLKTSVDEVELVEVKKEKSPEENSIIKEQNQVPTDQLLYFPVKNEEGSAQEAVKVIKEGLIKVNKKLGKIQVCKEFGTFPEKEVEPPVKKPKWTNACRGSEKVFFKNSATNTFDCLYCSFTTDSQHVIKQHLINAHQTEIPTYKCPHCDSTYFKGSNLKRHILAKHMNQRYECTFSNCTVLFQDRSALRRHLSGAHGSLQPHEIDELVKQAKIISVNSNDSMMSNAETPRYFLPERLATASH
ncbi:zinc finger protein Xfin-like isoform X1 [Chironomus tepperi]|uniref:zinc finger protein Xfin-like isoform X1 n=1 Tax=Chironomus tepperi TaxID=113505 RepID=UPI00391F7236